MSTPNPHLEEARADMNRAARKASEARTAYNCAAREWKTQKDRVERLEIAELDDRLALAREREKAQAEGNHTLAALLSR